MDLGVSILRGYDDGFNWDVNANFTVNKSEVVDLGSDTDIIVYAGFSDLGNAAITGEPLGVIVGSRIKRNDAGEFLVNSAGDYIVENGQFIIGDPNPDWVLNIGNNLSFKNFNFSFLEVKYLKIKN